MQEEIKFELVLKFQDMPAIGITASSFYYYKLNEKIDELIAEGWDIDKNCLYKHNLKVVEQPILTTDNKLSVTLYANKKSAEELYRERFDYFINQ